MRTETIDSIVSKRLVGRKLVKLDKQPTPFEGIIMKAHTVITNAFQGMELVTINHQNKKQRIILPFDQANEITTEP